jgi:ankyrin repeat protein
MRKQTNRKSKNKTEPTLLKQKKIFEILCQKPLKKKDQENIRYTLSSQETDLNITDKSGMSYLHFAVVNRHILAVKWLIDGEAEVNKAAPKGITPLSLAAELGYTELVMLLLEAGATVNKAMDDGCSPLFIAAKKGHEAVVGALLAAGADVNQVLTDEGWTPLMIAVNSGHKAVAKMLIRAGGKIGAEPLTDEKQKSYYQECKEEIKSENRMFISLCVAIQKGQDAIVKELLAEGVDLSKTTINGETALYIAAQEGNAAVVKVLLGAGANADNSRDDGCSPLYIAAQNGHTDVVRALLAKGGTVDKARDDGVTPLIIAAQNGNAPVLQALIDGGADVDLANNDGFTPLMMAATSGQVPVVAQLLVAGAVVDKADDNGYAPLVLAVLRGHIAVVQALLAAKADMETEVALTNELSIVTTPLVIAATRVDVPVLQALIDGGADVNRTMKDGTNPLYIATTKGHAAVLQALLDGGANVDIVDKDGNTPLYIAANSGHKAVAKMLIRAGGKIGDKPFSEEKQKKLYQECKEEVKAEIKDVLISSQNEKFVKKHVKHLQLQELSIEAQLDKIYEEAIENNKAAYQYFLGCLFQNRAKQIKEESAEIAKEVEENYIIAREYFSNASNQDYPKAIFSLGVMNEYGEGLDKNLSRAKELYTIARDKLTEEESLENEGYLKTIEKRLSRVEIKKHRDAASITLAESPSAREGGAAGAGLPLAGGSAGEAGAAAAAAASSSLSSGGAAGGSAGAGAAGGGAVARENVNISNSDRHFFVAGFDSLQGKEGVLSNYQRDRDGDVTCALHAALIAGQLADSGAQALREYVAKESSEMDKKVANWQGELSGADLGDVAAQIRAYLRENPSKEKIRELYHAIGRNKTGEDCGDERGKKPENETLMRCFAHAIWSLSKENDLIKKVVGSNNVAAETIGELAKCEKDEVESLGPRLLNLDSSWLVDEADEQGGLESRLYFYALARAANSGVSSVEDEHKVLLETRLQSELGISLAAAGAAAGEQVRAQQ